jgi:hypothetical protein
MKGRRHPGLGGTSAMFRESVVITYGEVVAAVFTVSILTFLLLV